jgi:hypothetical protein
MSKVMIVLSVIAVIYNFIMLSKGGKNGKIGK